MVKIHPTAIVDKDAQIEEGVEIGPYCIVEKNTVIKKGTKLESSVVIKEGTEIGENNIICHGAILGGVPQDIKFFGEKSKLIIGNGNIIREYVTIHRACGEGEKTTVGNNNYIMIQAHFGHNCKIGNNTIIVNNVALAGYVEVEDQVFISGLVGVHQFVKIGKLSIIGGLSAVRHDVPPFSMVIGNPARLYSINSVGLQRAGFSEEKIEQMRKVFKILFMSELELQDAVKKVRETYQSEETEYLISFLLSSKRGWVKWEKELKDL